MLVRIGGPTLFSVSWAMFSGFTTFHHFLGCVMFLVFGLAV